MLDSYVLQLTAVALAGMLVHEGCHYGTARALGTAATPAIMWGDYLPAPAVRVNLREHTPLSYRVVALAPLAVCVPSLAVFLASTPGLALPAPPTTASLWFMWLIATLPSPSDWEQSWHAGELTDDHAVWFGDHPTHAAAEGM